jgi:hypothetical protein
MFSQRIQAQFQQFQAFIASLNIEQDDKRGENEDEKNGEELTRDQFDLRKIIVVVSASGKLFGLDTIGKCGLWHLLLIMEVIFANPYIIHGD